MTERCRGRLGVVPKGSSLSVSEVLAATVPEAFRLSGDVVRFDVDPWLALTYAYGCRRPARLDVSGLPAAMRHELAWWLYSLRVDGERVNSHVLVTWVKVAAALSRGPACQVRSFADLSVGEWVAAARGRFYDRHGRLPEVSFDQNYRATIARCCRSLEMIMMTSLYLTIVAR